VREAVARRLCWLGLELDPAANAAGEARISRPQSRIACLVVPTDEELMIARHTLRILRERAGARAMESTA
jgi:acetate kinase